MSSAPSHGDTFHAALVYADVTLELLASPLMRRAPRQQLFSAEGKAKS